MKRLIFLCVLFYLHGNVCAHSLRVVSLAPNLTEIIYALKAENNLVGDTLQCDFPISAMKKYKVGDYSNPSLERILVLKPDIVLATEGNPRWLLNKLQEQKIRIVETNPQTVNELPSAIETIARTLEVENQGTQLSQEIKIALNTLRKRHKLQQKYLLVLQSEPIYSVSDNTWLGDLFKQAGFKNVVAQSFLKYPTVTKEYLIKNMPTVIFLASGRSKENDVFMRNHFKSLFGENAFKKIKIITLPPDIFMRAGPRIIDAIHFMENIKFD